MLGFHPGDNTEQIGPYH